MFLIHISGRLSTRIDSAPTQNQEMTKTKLSEYESNDDIKKLDNPDNMVSDKIGLKQFAGTGRGVVAKRDININETILQIRNLITPLVATETDSELVEVLDNSPDASIDIQDLMTLWMISLGRQFINFANFSLIDIFCHALLTHEEPSR